MSKKTKNDRGHKPLVKQMPFHMLMLPGMVILAVFWFVPMIYGLIMPFINYKPVKGFFGSDFVGLKYFIQVFKMPNIGQVMFNTVYIAVMKIVLGLVVTLIFALLLNEVRNSAYRKTLQTIVYFPNFVSWVLLAGIFITFLSPSEGIVNKFLGLFGIEPIFFLADNNWFPYIMVITDVWKGFGWGTIIYLAALSSIDPGIYESAVLDGASRWKQTWYITIPGIMPIIVLQTVLAISGVLNAGFDQIFNMYNATVYKSGDILDTLVYRIGLIDQQYSLSAAIGLFRSIVSIVLVMLSYRLADKVAGYRVI